MSTRQHMPQQGRGRRTVLLLALALLAVACARPLTESERGFARSLVGDSADLDGVRVAGAGPADRITAKRPKRPRRACRERIWPEPKSETVTVGTAAFVLFNTIYVSRPYMRRDFAARYPESLDLADAMLFAHEITHVWQWQNRGRTGYSPWKAAREHQPGGDPYLLDLDGDAPRFLDLPYEQQAAVVEEYVCCHSLDPEGARTERLYRMLKGVFPLETLRSASPRPDVRLPWKGAEVAGICG